MSLEQPAVLDAMARDTGADKLILAMYEHRPWEGVTQLNQLQDKMNAYLSFVLDGELIEAFPQFAGKPVEIQLRTVHEPDERASDLIRRMREQLAFQQINFFAVQISEAEANPGGGGSCGSGCGCH